jgi:hypothetical protein
MENPLGLGQKACVGTRYLGKDLPDAGSAGEWAPAPLFTMCARRSGF